MIPCRSHNVGVRNHTPNVAISPAESWGTVQPSVVVPIGIPVPDTPSGRAGWSVHGARRLHTLRSTRHSELWNCDVLAASGFWGTVLLRALFTPARRSRCFSRRVYIARFARPGHGSPSCPRSLRVRRGHPTAAHVPPRGHFRAGSPWPSRPMLAPRGGATAVHTPTPVYVPHSP